MKMRRLPVVVSICLMAVLACALHLPPLARAALLTMIHNAPVADPSPPPVNPNDPIFDVVGGSVAPPGAWPWLVALVFADEPDEARGQFCGGSLIAPEWVVTAAHCVTTSFGSGVASPESIDVVLGRQDLTSSAGERVDVAQIVRFPSFEPSGSMARDYALLRLATPSQRPIIEVAGPEDSVRFAPGTLAAIAGWGALAYGGEYPTIVQQAVVPIVSNNVCNGPYGGDINISHLCAGYIEEGGIDTCQGDSGGPLMVRDETGGWLLAGITSTGEGCAYPNFPGVYARVAPFKAWVDAVINKTAYLDIVKTGPRLAAPNEPFSYTLQLDNSGPAPLTNVVITDVVPSGLSVTGISNGGTINGDRITWNIGSLASGEMLELTYSAASPNTVESGSYGARSAEGVSASGLFPVVTVINEASLGLTISADGSFRVGKEITYTLTLYNKGLGPDAAANTIILRDVLPKNVEYLRGGTLENGVVSWTIPSLQSGELLKREVVVRPLAFGTLYNNNYSASYDSGQTQVGTISSRVPVSGVDLDMSLKGPSRVVTGSPITYTLTLSNAGDLTANSLVISYTLPKGASFIRATSDGSFKNGVVTWERSSLSRNSRVTYQVAVTGTTTLVNTTYGARAEDSSGYEYRVKGTEVITTSVLHDVYLPVVEQTK